MSKQHIDTIAPKISIKIVGKLIAQTSQGTYCPELTEKTFYCLVDVLKQHDTPRLDDLKLLGKLVARCMVVTHYYGCHHHCFCHTMIINVWY